ncbi:type IV pilus twitching motility protein PilT [Baekduia sp.]|uniref:type IV pilus twitching motility protein PilT n=1 Tax=Baekduia sp. TaxID=2600305 RepID=UPI002DFE1985|nr:type IV pilus twitching motility protein PilT [Baekduia sp.]
MTDQPDVSFDLHRALSRLIELNGSDLHLKVPSQPLCRVDGDLVPIPGAEPLAAEDTDGAVRLMLGDDSVKLNEFDSDGEVDFAYAVAGLARFRVNAFRQRGSVSIVMRAIPYGIKTIEELDLPPVIRDLAEEERGIVLLTGTTGSGKSTTLASMIDHINSTKARHVVTVEDPIEFLHVDKRSVINQREIGMDTKDFKAALRRVLRQDPDVILIGEMRDPETVWAALSAAETGHLVLSTLHTMGAVETITRIIDFFPPFQQQQVRMSVATSLKGIISQRLIERSDHQGRIPAMEVLVNTGRVFDKIADGEATHELDEIIADGEFYGMQTFDQALRNLYEQGIVTRRDALATATNSHDLRLKLDHLDLSRAQESLDGEASTTA